MKKFFIFLFIPLFIFAYQVEIKSWGKKDTFYGFLKQHKIPFSLYYNLPKNIRADLGHIPVNSDIYLLKDGNTIKQALVPFNDKKQLQIIKKDDSYITKIVPIEYTTEEKVAKINIKNFLSYDVYQATKNPYLSKKLVNIFKDRINFRVLPKDTNIEVYYTVKERFGKIANVDIIFANIKNRYYDISAYKYTDGRYYDSNGKSLKGMFLAYPLRFTRISSPFGRRFHPILHKWRMHDGIDFVNRVGTPIHTVADGKVIYKGWIRGYGNCVEVRHKDGYMTLYGHLKGFGHIRNGQWIQQGKVIGYLGNTGLSTGPHLHFGVMHNGRWINPIKIKKSAKIRLYGKRKKRFLAYMKNINKKFSDTKVAMK
jgi:murein DD-endopeptidase MepM/ murein hydrolase activator NlpD